MYTTIIFIFSQEPITMLNHMFLIKIEYYDMDKILLFYSHEMK